MAAMEPVLRGSETVLLVEPEPETRKLAAFMLAKRGYRVLEARDAAEALNLCDGRANVDLLFTEARMSKVSGQQLAETLTARQPGLKVLYLCDTRAERAARREPAVRQAALLLRPFTMGVLSAKVREVLDTPREKALRAG